MRIGSIRGDDGRGLGKWKWDFPEKLRWLERVIEFGTEREMGFYLRDWIGAGRRRKASGGWWRRSLEILPCCIRSDHESECMFKSWVWLMVFGVLAHGAKPNVLMICVDDLAGAEEPFF